jgi:hypothetical protein
MLKIRLECHIVIYIYIYIYIFITCNLIVSAIIFSKLLLCNVRILYL